MVLHLLDAVNVISPQPFGSDSPVISFDIGILLRLARLDVDQADPGLFCPVLRPGTDVFGAIVYANGQRFPAPGNDLVQCPDHAFRRQREVAQWPVPHD